MEDQELYGNEQEQPDDKEGLLAAEGDILRGLLDAASDQKEETIRIEIARKGKVYFSFRIRGLSEREYNKCRDDATKFKKNRQLGVRMPEDTDTARFRSLLIYRATVDEDRKAIWNNRDAWNQLNVVNGPDLIDKVLLAGEKDAVIEKIDELSGYDDELEETAKNS